MLTLVGAASAYAVVQGWLKGLPDYTSQNAFEVAQATRVYSADGQLLAKLYLQNRDVVPISQIATSMSQGVVAVEDERFYQHGGVDPLGIVRAMFSTAGGDRQGASTITQQYVRNTILLGERNNMTLARKVREAYLAMQVEKRYTKDEILGMYLNTVYFGEGAYGAQAAARTYFAKDASQLTLPEGALIAGLAQSPSALDPYNNPDGAVARRNKVLSRMLYNNYITQADYSAAIATPLKLKRDKEPPDGIYSAPYFVADVKRRLQQQFSPAVVFQGGLTVYTTLDTREQAIAEAAAHAKFKGKNDPEVALVSIDPRSGYVKAMVGGRDYSKSKFNLATQAYRQPGSSFKTFVLTTAIDQGMPPYYSIDSNSPVTIPSKPPWTVSNDEGTGSGMMSLDAATWNSVNAVYARLAWAIGIKNIAKTAKRMGITTPLPNYPSIALGSVGCTPLEMASAYGTLATGGTHYDPIEVTKVLDRNGQVIYQAKPDGSQVVRPQVARVVTDVLRGVIQQGTATAADIGRPAAGKTGTSQLNRDNWFVGYTPQLVTAVWVGYKTEKTIYVDGSKGFGGSTAAPIWAAFMKKALAGMPALEFPKASAPTYDESKFNIPVSDSTLAAKNQAKKKTTTTTTTKRRPTTGSTSGGSGTTGGAPSGGTGGTGGGSGGTGGTGGGSGTTSSTP